MLNFQQQGNGPSIVLVHGFLASGEIFQSLAKHLSTDFSVTSIDLPGCAGSYDVPVPATVEELCDMVVETIRSIGIDQCSILGHSLGAWIALEASLRHPSLLEKIVIYGGSPDGYCPERFETYEQSIERIRSEGIKTFGANLAAEWFLQGKNDPMYSAALEAGKHCSEEAAIKHVQSWNNWITRDRLSHSRTPALIVCGDNDRSTHPDLSIEMWKGIESSQLFIIPNSGHAAHLEHPSEFNSMVAKFLK